MKAIYGLYSHPDTAQRAVEGLRAAGLAEDQITVISSQPFEEHALNHRDRATWLPWIAVCGGLVGLTLGYLLVTTTEQAWPIVTGGMPIVATWPNLIIMFEVTMICAILTTLGTLLITAGLPSYKPALYDPEVTDGQILVGVQDPPAASLDAIQRVLSMNGMGRLKTIG
jgi:hypothetical protein